MLKACQKLGLSLSSSLTNLLILILVCLFLMLSVKIQELNDDSSNSILGCMPRALEFIDNARKNGGAVFVHCAQGVSRSGSIVVGYLMKSRDLSFTDALCFARKGHPICQPNSYFKQEMQTKEAWIRSGCKTSL